jgi:hemoglobin
MTKPTPTLYDWLGGMPVLEKLTTRFYERVRDDAVLAPIFAHMRGDHPRYVAQFLAEVLGGPADYSRERGGHPHMVAQHLAKHLSQEQRKQWVRLLLDTAD